MNSKVKYSVWCFVATISFCFGCYIILYQNSVKTVIAGRIYSRIETSQHPIAGYRSSENVIFDEEKLPSSSEILERIQNLESNLTRLRDISSLGVDTHPRMENVRLADRKKSMLILTSMRSGSSFAGELFNQHPDVFYVFEPLYFLLGDAGYERKLRVLESIFTCNFTSFETLYDEANNISAQAFQKNIENCRKTKFCFRDKIKALTSKIGKIPDWAELSHRCQTAKLRVVKTLRIYKLSWLKRFFEDQRLDLRILHLVRDPRAVFRSRSHIFNTNESMGATGHNCKMHSNIEYESRALPGRVATVRYEDITANPLRFQERIYSYVGLEKHQDVIKWVKDNTNKSDNSTYGTSRMAEKQLGKWREDIEFSNVATVQDICSEMMTIFNYKRLQSELEMRDLNVNIYPT